MLYTSTASDMESDLRFENTYQKIFDRFYVETLHMTPQRYRWEDNEINKKIQRADIDACLTDPDFTTMLVSEKGYRNPKSYVIVELYSGDDPGWALKNRAQTLYYLIPDAYNPTAHNIYEVDAQAIRNIALGVCEEHKDVIDKIKNTPDTNIRRIYKGATIYINRNISSRNSRSWTCIYFTIYIEELKKLTNVKEYHVNY